MFVRAYIICCTWSTDPGPSQMYQPIKTSFFLQTGSRQCGMIRALELTGELYIVPASSFLHVFINHLGSSSMHELSSVSHKNPVSSGFGVVSHKKVLFNMSLPRPIANATTGWLIANENGGSSSSRILENHWPTKITYPTGYPDVYVNIYVTAHLFKYLPVVGCSYLLSEVQVITTPDQVIKNWATQECTRGVSQKGWPAVADHRQFG